MRVLTRFQAARSGPAVARGSALVVVIVFSTLLVYAAMEAVPLYRHAVERSRRHERAYRIGRINEAVRRFHARTGRYPHALEDLVPGRSRTPFLPRVYADPVKRSACWCLVREPGGGIVRVEPPERPEAGD